MHLDLGARTSLRCVGWQRRLCIERSERALCRIIGEGRDRASGLVAGIEELPALSKGEMTRGSAKFRRLHRRRRVWRQCAGRGVESVDDDLVKALLRHEEELAIRR